MLKLLEILFNNELLKGNATCLCWANYSLSSHFFNFFKLIFVVLTTINSLQNRYQESYELYYILNFNQIKFFSPFLKIYFCVFQLTTTRTQTRKTATWWRPPCTRSPTWRRERRRPRRRRCCRLPEARRPFSMSTPRTATPTTWAPPAASTTTTCRCWRRRPSTRLRPPPEPPPPPRWRRRRNRRSAQGASRRSLPVSSFAYCYIASLMTPPGECVRG